MSLYRREEDVQVSLYIYYYYQGLWQQHVSHESDLRIRASDVWVWEIQMDPTPENVAWLANHMRTQPDNVTEITQEVPTGIEISVTQSEPVVFDL